MPGLFRGLSQVENLAVIGMHCSDTELSVRVAEGSKFHLISSGADLCRRALSEEVRLCHLTGDGGSPAKSGRRTRRGLQRFAEFVELRSARDGETVYGVASIRSLR